MCLGMPGRVVDVLDAPRQSAIVDVDGKRREVSVSMLELAGQPGVRVGDWVVVHLGLAMTRIDETEARHLLESMRELTDLYERELSVDL
ncbi:MAG: HypC/HybG/HupF family hydrogenase formation chaperone [Sporichthyaceae bacterium]|nr:HypC/HybG/HupF family hydrogenase formation chaperone [Sporichthyaceae bacterium]